jgi:hypothetical protein
VDLHHEIHCLQSTKECFRDDAIPVPVTALTGSTLTLMAISADRLMAVKYPLRQLHKHCGKIVLIIWTLAGSASTPFLIYRRLATFKVKQSILFFTFKLKGLLIYS